MKLITLILGATALLAGAAIAQPADPTFIDPEPLTDALSGVLAGAPAWVAVLVPLALSGVCAWLSAAVKDGSVPAWVATAINTAGGNVGRARNDEQANQ